MATPPALTADELALRRILEAARKATGIDFSAYKPNTIGRRVRARMAQAAIETLTVYASRVEADGGEALRLSQTLLISTTSLFREPSTFDLLRRRALPELVRRRRVEGATTLRAWVPACSTGEEAFSLGMCLIEAIERAGPTGATLAPMVVGSDASWTAITRARAGSVRADDCSAVPPEFAARWLEIGRGQIGIDASITSIVRFAQHDLLGSPKSVPREAVLASFDVVSCRNLFIYLTQDAQERALLRLIKACAPGAFVVLGAAESPPTALADELEVVEAGLPVYRLASGA